MSGELKDHRTEALVEPTESFRVDGVDIAIDRSFVTRQNRHNLNSRIKIINDGSRSLELNAVKNRLEGIEQDLARDERNNVRV